MSFRISTGSATTATILCCIMFEAGACRKRESALETSLAARVTLAPDLKTNNLAALPGAVYRSQASSPIRWQPWTKDSMDKAKAANRLVFAAIAMPQLPGFQTVLSALAKDPALVSALNDSYVPVLIDGDASREAGLLAADLCAELKRGMQMPLFVWMTSDGDPVAWIPVARSASAKVSDLFNQSHSTVSRMWAEDSGYVKKNSAWDNSSRRQRIALRKNSKVMSDNPAEDVLRSLRQLSSFYDPDSRTFDEAGGLFPSGTIELLASAAVQPGVPAEIRARCMETTRELLVDLLPSAMFDPLEGGIFASRQGNSWAFPTFSRDCVSQARAVVALCHAYRATRNPQVLEKALDLISFSEKFFTTTEGLFSLGVASETDSAVWLWTVEDIEKELAPVDAAWWIKATGMKGLGNLPSEVDPRREFFRCNSLGLGKSLAQLAADQSEKVDKFAPRFDSIRKKLLEVRNARLGKLDHDDCSHAGASFRMVSAYAAAFGITGDVKNREKAVALMEKCKAAFSDGPKLRMFTQASPASVGEGRAFLYGLAMQAALDLSDITSEEKWSDWAEDLATTAAELFTGSDFLKECPDDAKIIDLPVTDLTMLFDDSTSGLISFAECRLAERGRPLVATFSELATPLSIYAVDKPILHTDQLQATLAREFKVSVIAGTGLSSEMKLAVEMLPIRMFQRRSAKSSERIPAGSVMILFQNGENRLASSPEALQEAVLPLPGKL